MIHRLLFPPTDISSKAFIMTSLLNVQPQLTHNQQAFPEQHCWNVQTVCWLTGCWFKQLFYSSVNWLLVKQLLYSNVLHGYYILLWQTSTVTVAHVGIEKEVSDQCFNATYCDKDWRLQKKSCYQQWHFFLLSIIKRLYQSIICGLKTTAHTKGDRFSGFVVT